MQRPAQTRRKFLRDAALATVAVALPARAADSVTLPFENGERALVAYPQKRPLIVVTQRPPQLETPFSVFGQNVITPNDAFFVRYHIPGLPLTIDPEKYRLEVKGEVQRPLSLSLAELKQLPEVSVTAVNQCSGNSRAFSTPRVGGGQWANGAMGNAAWKGARLKDVLEKAGVKAGAKQVTFDGLDIPAAPGVPDYIKALEIDHALDGESIVAYEMNGEALPVLNGFPVRLVVPGYYGTYWVKHLSEINVFARIFDGFWMNPAYRIPDTPDHSIEPGTTPAKTIPIAKLNVRSFLASHQDGANASRKGVTLKGIAFDGGSGIREVALSDDAGATWKPAQLGRDFGRYSFREWTLDYQPAGAGRKTILCRATANSGETQPSKAGWNPSGYLRNVIEQTTLNFT
jgi:DMSO/TMAO reductase YedYZ molybdopterin-dependent catalytic subunit